MAKAGGRSLCSRFIFFFKFSFPAGLIRLARRALPQFLFLQGSSGLPGELCQQSAFRFWREWSAYSFRPSHLQKTYWTLSDCVKKLNGLCRIADCIDDGGGCPDIRGRSFPSLYASGFFFPKALKATELFSGSRDLLWVEHFRILAQQIADSAADSK